MTIRQVLATTFVVTASLLPMALIAVEASAAQAKGKRVAVGKTKQGRTARLAVWAKQLKVVNFAAELKCRDGSTLVDKESGFQATPLRRGGRFSDKQYGSTDTVRFRGRVGAKWVRGTLRVTDTWDKVRCDSGWVKFSAKLK